MKERPILFSAPTVRAILDGRKTQTRRIVKPQPIGAGCFVLLDDGATWMDAGPGVTEHEYAVASDLRSEFRCPYGVPGDRLWVREAWAPYCGADRPVGHIEDCDAVRYAADEVTHLVDGNHAQVKGLDMYAVPPHRQMPGGPWRWRPSIHMPRWASRITLEVTGVRVERLRDISREDCVAEGIRYGDAVSVETRTVVCPLIDQFADLWDSINGPGAWDATPWVWAITFKRVKP